MSALFTDKIRQTTREYFLPKVVDAILSENPLAEAVLRNSKMWTGEKIKKAIKVKKSNTGQSVGISSIALLNNAPSQTRLSLEFAPKHRVHTVTLPLGEIAINAGSNAEEKFLNLAQTEIESTTQDMADDLGELFYGVGSTLDFQGLEAIVDDGTNVATYGTLSRGTYPDALNSTVVPSGGTLTLAVMRTAHNGASRGSVRPTAVYTTEDVAALYEQLLQPQERIQKVATARQRLVGGTGYSDLYYIDMPIIRDEHCPAGTMYMLRESDISFYAVTDIPQTSAINVASSQIDDSMYNGVTGLGFRATDWMLPANQTGVTMQIHIMGELVSFAPRNHAKITGITTV